MKIEDILAVKGTVVHRTSSDVTLQEVVAQLMDYRIGSLVVCRVGIAGEEEVVGVITDRDVLFAVATSHRTLDALTVGEAMTTELITGTMDDEVEYVMGLMTNHRIRHLPVLTRKANWPASSHR